MERSVVCVVAKKSQYCAGVNGSWEDVEELEAGEGGEGWDSDLVDAMKKLDEKGVRRAMRGLRREGRKRVWVFFLVFISVFLPLASCLLIAGFARWSNVNTAPRYLFSCIRSYPLLFFPYFPAFYWQALFHVPSIQIMLECTSPLLSQSPTTLTPHTAALPGDIPLHILLLQKYFKVIRYHRFSLPQLALRILQEVSVKEVVRAVLVSFFLFATPSLFTVTVAGRGTE
jgi:hypothetical protein